MLAHISVFDQYLCGVLNSISVKCMKYNNGCSYFGKPSDKCK